MSVSSLVSATIPDWTREAARGSWDPGRKLLKAIRDYQWALDPQEGRSRLLKAKFSVIRHKFWSLVTQCEIDLTCSIGGGLILPHPNGIVIHPQVKIGVNCLIFQQVTLGTRSKFQGVPIIGGHVDIGAGAKILGSIKIGDHAKVGANAVVLNDIPIGGTAVGVPARII